ncbi:MAG: LysE family transporter [Anaerolineae bacterium]
MTLAVFLLQAVLISLSGVMAPGPLTAVSVGKGNESPHAGAFVAIGHGIVEFPLMIGVLYGIGRLFESDQLQAGIALAGGMFLLLMSVDMLRNLRRANAIGEQTASSPLTAGALMSAGNPYFLVWWATVGATLILRSRAFGLVGFLAFALAHWLCDLSWNYFLSALAYKGGAFFGQRFHKAVFLVCGLFLAFFGASFIVSGIAGILG